MENLIMTNDPSMTGWGWAILKPDGTVVAAGAIKTEPTPRKLNVRKGDDRIRRIKELNTALIAIIEEYNPRLLLSEQPHGSQSASAAVMIGITAGVMQTIADCENIPIDWFTEGDAKKAISGARSVGKDEMVAIVNMRYKKVPWKNTKWENQAIADAIAVYHVAADQSELLKMIKND